MDTNDNTYLSVINNSMIDLKKFRANPEVYIKATKDKQFSIDFGSFQSLDKDVLELKTKLEGLLAERNSLTKEFEAAKKSGQPLTVQTGKT